MFGLPGGLTTVSCQKSMEKLDRLQVEPSENVSLMHLDATIPGCHQNDGLLPNLTLGVHLSIRALVES